MSENAEDFYLKGFMAYSAKNFAEAKQLWEKVLELDPQHAQARRGMEELAKVSRKKSSKEILQDIKKLYGDKKYEEALKLCEMLIRKYPDNQDLTGLRQRILQRLAPPAAQNMPTPAAPSEEEGEGSNFESTMYYTANAEMLVAAEPESVADEGESGTANQEEQVSRLIQEGVSLYELQDYERAVEVWQKALELDPSNRIAREYVTNVTAMLEPEPAKPTAPMAPPAAAKSSPKAAEPPKPVAVDNRPSKDALLEAYNKGQQFFQEKKYKEAMERWNFILQHHPGHKETIQCIERLKNAMAKQEQQQNLFEKARKEFSAGNTVEAESLLIQLTVEAPDLPGLDALKQAVEERKRQITEIRNLEIETSEPGESSYTATDAEITKYFTPENEGKKAEARQVTRVIVPKKEKKPLNLAIAIGVPAAVLVLAIGGYFAYRTYKTQLHNVDEPAIVLTQEPDWNSAQRQSDDYLTFGNDLVDESDFICAHLSYQRAIDLAKERSQEITKLPEEGRSLEIQDEYKKLLEIMTTASSKQKATSTKFKDSNKVGAKELESIFAEIGQTRFDSIAKRLESALAADFSNESLRNRIGRAFLKRGLELFKSGEFDESRSYFRKAAVLQTDTDMGRRHFEVIQRFFTGKASAEDRDQWFFFFLD